MMTHTIKKFFNIPCKGIKLLLFQIQNMSLFLHLIIHNSCQFLQHLVSNNSHFTYYYRNVYKYKTTEIYYIFANILHFLFYFFSDVQPPETSPVSSTPSTPTLLRPNSRSIPTTPIPSPQSPKIQHPLLTITTHFTNTDYLTHTPCFTTPPTSHHLPKLQPCLLHNPLKPLVLTYCLMRVTMIMVYLLNGHPPDPW